MMRYSPKIGWKRLVSESRKKILNEAEETPQERGNDSIDIQIDRFLSDYESESKMSKNESKDWRRLLRRLLEAEGDEEEGDEDSGSGSDAEETKAEKLKIEDIDLNNFANSISRLIDNYDSLLEIRTTILRRATNFINKNYELDVVEKFKDIMEDQFDLSVDGSPNTSSDEFQAPFADRAGSSGGGGA
jgi:hypothetical protein